jgi:hypothetical protein
MLERMPGRVNCAQPDRAELNLIAILYYRIGISGRALLATKAGAMHLCRILQTRCKLSGTADEVGVDVGLEYVPDLQPFRPCEVHKIMNVTCWINHRTFASGFVSDKIRGYRESGKEAPMEDHACADIRSSDSK